MNYLILFIPFFLTINGKEYIYPLLTHQLQEQPLRHSSSYSICQTATFTNPTPIRIGRNTILRSKPGPCRFINEVYIFIYHICAFIMHPWWVPLLPQIQDTSNWLHRTWLEATLCESSRKSHQWLWTVLQSLGTLEVVFLPIGLME